LISKRLKHIRKLKQENSNWYEIFDPKEAIERGLVKIGKNVHIHEGVIIGTDGFGFERNEDGKLEKMPHFFGVIIEDNVEIDGPAIVYRGGWRDTIIGEGTKIAGMCHIGHNVRIGKHTMLASHITLGGSCEIGDYVNIWSHSMVKEWKKVGNYATISPFSFVKDDVKPETKVRGIPAVEV